MVDSDEIVKLIATGEKEGLSKLLESQPGLADGKTEQGVSYLLLAAYYRNRAAVDLIAEKKSSIDLYEGAATGNLAGVRNVLDSMPAAVNSYSVDGFTPLGLACFFGHCEIAEYLIGLGAEVNIPSDNSFKVAPIHSACAIANFELVKLLIAHQADVNAKQSGDVTPLHQAAHNGQTRIAQLLMEAGAEVHAKTAKGETPAQMAREKSFMETAELIERHKQNR